MIESKQTSAPRGFSVSLSAVAMNRTNVSYGSYWNEKLGEMETMWNKYIQPCVLVSVICFNSLPLFIFNRSRFKCVSIGFYLKVLCCQNLLFIFVVYFPSWIAMTSQLNDIENFTDWGCCLYKFISSVFQYTGPWIVVAMAVDRYIAIWHPVSAPDRTTVFMAKIAIAIIYVAMVWLSVHELWFSRLDNGKCSTDISLVEVRVWAFFTGFVNGSLPLLVLFLFSGLIIVGLIVKGTVPSSTSGRPSADLTHSVLALAVLYVVLLVPVTVMLYMYSFYVYMVVTRDHTLIQKYSFLVHVMDKISLGIQFLPFFVLLINSHSFREECKEILLHIRGVLCGRRSNDSHVKLLRRNSTCVVELDNGREFATAVV